MAQLAHVKRDLWRKLPQDIRDLIAKWRREEEQNEESTAKVNVVEKEETSENDNDKLQFLRTEQLATIDEFIQEDEESENQEDGEVFVNMTKVERCNDDTEED